MPGKTKPRENLDPIAYIKTVIEEIGTKIKEADEKISEKNYVEAEKVFEQASNYYENRMLSLSKLQQKLYFPNMEDLKSSEKTRETYETASKNLVLCLAVLKVKRDKNAPIAEAQKFRNNSQAEKDSLAKTVHEMIDALEVERNALEILTKKLDGADEAYVKVTNGGKTSDDLAQAIPNMQILGAFIAALGATAVAIAFVALGAAGLAMPGVVLAGFGVGTALIGSSIFSSPAKNMDEYISNMHDPFSMA